MEGYAGQATDVRAGSAPRRPIAPARGALQHRPGGSEGLRDVQLAMASLSPRARAAVVRALAAERRDGTLNSPERIERAAERLLGA